MMSDRSSMGNWIVARLVVEILELDRNIILVCSLLGTPAVGH